MVEDIIIYGAGGMAREVAALLEDINKISPSWRILGFIDDFKGECNELINGYKILGNHTVLQNYPEPINIVIAVGDPALREKIYDKIKSCNYQYPVLIHPTARVAGSAVIGEGSIIGMDAIVQVNASIGQHVLINMRTVLGHDVVVQDFSTCLVNCIISGNVTIGKGALLGSSCVIMEKITIGEGAKVSMGAVVSFNVEEGCVAMSRPSKSMRF
jgi:sugar O-acyltransferase (sialic acid O-acetyltransferase NeuD family)